MGSWGISERSLRGPGEVPWLPQGSLGNPQEVPGPKVGSFAVVDVRFCFPAPKHATTSQILNNQNKVVETGSKLGLWSPEVCFLIRIPDHRPIPGGSSRVPGGNEALAIASA